MCVCMCVYDQYVKVDALKCSALSPPHPPHYMAHLIKGIVLRSLSHTYTQIFTNTHTHRFSFGNGNRPRDNLQHTAARCNTLQHTATHCNTLQHTLQQTATHCSTLQHIVTHTTTHCNTLQHIATHTTTHCNKHCNKLQYTNLAPPFFSLFWP